MYVLIGVAIEKKKGLLRREVSVEDLALSSNSIPQGGLWESMELPLNIEELPLLC